MTALLAGPEGRRARGVPRDVHRHSRNGTRLLGISIADKVATVNLSKEWKAAQANFQGGTATAQVVYTLTQFPTVKLVRIEIDGVSPGGAVGRSDFQVQGILPAIFVDRPAWGAAAGNPVDDERHRQRVRGHSSGSRSSTRRATSSPTSRSRPRAAPAAGARSRQGVAYGVAKAQYGTLRVFDLSAKDGIPENVTEYRVWLTP